MPPVEPTAIDLAVLEGTRRLVLLENAFVRSDGSGTEYQGLDVLDKLYLTVVVNRVKGKPNTKELTVTVEDSDDAVTWGTKDDTTFSGRGTYTAVLSTLKEFLRVSWSLVDVSEAVVATVEVRPSSLNT